MAELSNWKRPCSLQNLKYLLSGPWQKRWVNPWSRWSNGRVPQSLLPVPFFCHSLLSLQGWLPILIGPWTVAYKALTLIQTSLSSRPVYPLPTWISTQWSQRYLQSTHIPSEFMMFPFKFGVLALFHILMNTSIIQPVTQAKAWLLSLIFLFYIPPLPCI